MRSLLVCFLGLLCGIGIGFYFFFYSPQTLISLKNQFFPSSVPAPLPQKQIIGFLPYWLVTKAQIDYSDYITTLTYFGLTIASDGTIQYLVNEQEEEPGYHMLKSEKLQTMLTSAKKNGMVLSLLVFNADSDAIDVLLSNPSSHAKNLVTDVEPIMKKYHFTDLNIDIESTRLASDEARENFTIFIQTVKQEMTRRELGTVTVEITGQDLIKKTQIDPKAISQYADSVVIMAYDFHYPGSLVSGPIAPLGGTEAEAEFDVKTVLSQAFKYIPREKIILGVPSYGYSWETIAVSPGSATIPGSGITVSNNSAEKLLASCASCSAKSDEKAQEQYVIYQDTQTGTYHQLFYPDSNALQKKVDTVVKENIGGIALWALGYEANNMYKPLIQYKKDTTDPTRLFY